MIAFALFDFGATVCRRQFTKDALGDDMRRGNSIVMMLGSIVLHATQQSN
jgi:hypothetical protein